VLFVPGFCGRRAIVGLAFEAEERSPASKTGFRPKSTFRPQKTGPKRALRHQKSGQRTLFGLKNWFSGQRALFGLKNLHALSPVTTDYIYIRHITIIHKNKNKTIFLNLQDNMLLTDVSD